MNKHCYPTKIKRAGLLTAFISTTCLIATPAFAVKTVTGSGGCIMSPGGYQGEKEASDNGNWHTPKSYDECRKPVPGFPPNEKGKDGQPTWKYDEWATADSVNDALKDLQDQINAGSGGLTDINDKLADQDKKNKEQNDRLADQDDRLNDHENRLNDQDKKNKEQDDRLAEHDDRLNDHENRLNDHENRISDIEDSAVKYKRDADGNLTNEVILTGDGTGSPVTISNVASGTEKNDAVNVGQLEGALAGLGGGAGVGQDGKIIGPTYNIGGKDYHNVGDALDATNNRIDEIVSDTAAQVARLDGRISDVQAEARAGIAGANALAGMRYDDRPGKASLAMAWGGFKGSTAMAVGAGYTTMDGVWRVNAGLTHDFNGQGAFGWNAGMSWTFN